MKEKWYFLLATLSLFASCLFISTPAQAVTVNPASIYWRSYAINGNMGNNVWNVVPYLPATILTDDYANYKILNGFTVETSPTDTISTRYKTVETEVILRQGNGNNLPAGIVKSFQNGSSFLSVEKADGNFSTSPQCTMTWLNQYTVSFFCRWSDSDYASVNHIQVNLGYPQATSPMPNPLGVICGTDRSPFCTNDIILQEFNYSIYGHDSPSDTNVEIIRSEVVEIHGEIVEMNEKLDNINDSTNHPEYIEEEREELENNESALQDESENATEEVEENTQNLTQAIGSIIDVFKNAEPSNCKIPLNTGNFNVGEIDLCQAPNEIRTMIQIMLSIPITIGVLHIAYELVMMYVIYIRKEQE